MTRRASYREGLSYGAASFGSLALLGLFSSVVIARVYGVEVLGEYALSFAPVGALGYLSTTQEQAALLRKLAVLEARSPRITGLFVAVFSFSLILTVVIAVPVLVVAYLLFSGPIGQPDLFTPALVQVIGYIVLTNTCWNLDTVLSSFRAGRQLFWVRLLQALMFFGTATAVGAVTRTVWGVVIATIVSWGTALVARAWSVRPFMQISVSRGEVREGFRELPEVVRFGLKLAPGSLLAGVSQEANTWILGIVGTVSAVGAWSRAWTLGVRVQDATIKTNEVLVPTLVERRETGDADGHDRALMESVRYAATGMLLIAAAGGGAAHGVMDVFGPGFSQAATALALVLLAEGAGIVPSLLGTSVMAAGRPWTVTVVSAIRATAVVVSSIFLSMAFGVTGAGLAMCIGTAITLYLYLVQARRIMFGSVRRFLPVRWVPAVVGAYLSGFAVAWLVDRAAPGILGTAAALIAGCFAYVGAFIILGGVHKRDRARIAELIARRRSRREVPGTAPPAE